MLAFLATSVLQQIAEDHGQELPQAANAIPRNFYVDDCILGASSIEEAIFLRESLCTLISKGEMTLRKWRSNCQTVIDSIPESLRETYNDSDLLFPSQSPKALGIHWITSTDKQYMSVPALKPREITTKRTIASDLGKVFDVLGLFAPSLFQAKILIQQLWLTGLFLGCYNHQEGVEPVGKGVLNLQLTLFQDLTIM